MTENYKSPFTIWWDENIQSRYGVGEGVRELMAMAFEGGRKSKSLRELTNEEILDLVAKNIDFYIPDHIDPELIKFARATLKKASEK